MKTKSVQLYPSTANFQLTNQDSVPFRQVAAMVAKIVDSLPADERDGVVITGWTGIRIVNPGHKVSEMEALQEKHAALLAALAAASRDGLTADQLKELLHGA